MNDPVAVPATRPEPRVFRMSTWAIVAIGIAGLLFVACGGYLAAWESNVWYRIGGGLMIPFGIAGVLDAVVSRIVLDEESVAIVSLVRRRRYLRSEFESAKVDGGYVCLKRHDGGWLVLPGTGGNALGMRNTVHAWIRAGHKRSQDQKQRGIPSL